MPFSKEQQEALDNYTKLTGQVAVINKRLADLSVERGTLNGKVNTLNTEEATLQIALASHTAGIEVARNVLEEKFNVALPVYAEVGNDDDRFSGRDG